MPVSHFLLLHADGMKEEGPHASLDPLGALGWAPVL